MKIVLLFGLLTTAFAVESDSGFSFNLKKARAFFDLIDRNGDELIHMSEIFTQFRNIDTDGDKKVTREEYAAGLSPETPSSVVASTFTFFDGMDDKVDGVLDSSIVCNVFSWLDEGRNRKANFGEFRQAVEKMLSSISGE